MLYQVNLILINQVKDDGNVNSILERSYNVSQIRLWKLLNDISYNDIIELWKISYIRSKNLKSYYVVILEDSTLLCICMFIVNQGMICCHQLRVLIKSKKVIFYILLIHTCWFNSNLLDSISFIMIVNGERRHTAIPLSYMNNLRTENVYTSIIRGQVSKKIKYKTVMSIAKTSIQITIIENVTFELIRILMQFIMKYCRNMGLSIDIPNNIISFSDTEDNKGIES